MRCNTERAVNFNLDAVVQAYMKTLHEMGFSKDFFFCLETAVWVLRVGFQEVGAQRSFGQRAGRSCELALTCFPKTFPQNFSLSPPNLVISAPPSKPSQPFWLPAPTPSHYYTYTSTNTPPTSQKGGVSGSTNIDFQMILMARYPQSKLMPDST